MGCPGGRTILADLPVYYPDGTTGNCRIDLYRPTCFVLESKQFQEAKAKASQLELAAGEAGLVSRKKSSQSVRYGVTTR